MKMRDKSTFAILAATMACLFAWAPTASADQVIGPGQTLAPNGLAVDTETGRLYVADTGNNRVTVFGPSGSFEEAYGWGVDTGASQFEICTAASGCNAGIAGAGKGQFDRPTAIAVDNSPTSASRHAVYVVDYNNRRVQKFDEDGNFLLTFGGGVNKTVPGDVCTAASGDVCGEGEDGSGEGEFTATDTQSGIFIGVGPGGVVHVLDSENPGSNESEFKSRLQRFEPSGVVIAPQYALFEGERSVGLAVASNGDFYASGAVAIRKYNAAGTQIGLIPGDNISALAVDTADNLFAAEGSSGLSRSIVEYDASGATVRRFGYGALEARANALAPDNSGNSVYVSEIAFLAGLGRIQQLDFPPPGPLIFPAPCQAPASDLGSAKATLRADVNPEGKATTFHFEYITDDDFIANDNSFSGPKPAATTPESASIGSDFVLHQATATVTGLTPETKYHCRVVASNADAPGGIIGEAGEFETKEQFEILATWSEAVKTETAMLGAEVNPLETPASGRFEYVTDAAYQADKAKGGEHDGFEGAQLAPAPPASALDFGSGEDPVRKSALLTGLSPGTLYHYRIAVTNTAISPETKKGEERTFRTYIALNTPVPDDRAHELVSPPQKNSAEVGVQINAGGLANLELFNRIQAAAGSGEAITYTSWTSFGEAQGAPGTSQYLSKRGAGGWGTENISPFGFQHNALEISYRGFSADLAFGAEVVSEPPLTPEAITGFENLYLRDNQSGELQALTIEAPTVAPGEIFCTGYAGTSTDGSRAFFAANGAFLATGAPTGPGFSLYEWSAADGLALISRLPGEAPAAPALGTSFGAKGGGCQTAQKIARNVVSADGSKVFWTYAPEATQAEKDEDKAPRSQLLVRVDGAETRQLDKPNAAVAPAGGGVFKTASTDGTVAFFTDDIKLVSGASAVAGKPDLYRYALNEGTTPLSDLTKGSEPADVLGVVGASDDGAYVYYVARGVLSAEENAAGDKAIAGKPNLYMWHAGQTSFIGTLSNDDEDAWLGVSRSRVSPDGTHLAFTSTEAESLVGYDNTILVGTHCQEGVEEKLVGGPHCPQVFLFEAETKGLRCASCNPSGSRPLGPSALPAPTNPYEGPRELSEDGSRVFFESLDALLPDDESKRRDVYEFELSGVGTCGPQSPNLDPVSGGCVSLVSDGKSSDESYLIDASSDGRDVFLATRQRLVGWDKDDNYDVYDYREGGGFPEPTTPAICEGEACKPPPSAPPPPPSPATPGFSEPTNAKPKKQKKQKKQKNKGKNKKGKSKSQKGRSGR